jgi:hypothetical protein
VYSKISPQRLSKQAIVMAERTVPVSSWMSPDYHLQPYDGPPRNIAYIENLKFDSHLQPKNYEIAGTHPDSKILILDVEILDATGKPPYRGDVLIVGMA